MALGVYGRRTPPTILAWFRFADIYLTGIADKARATITSEFSDEICAVAVNTRRG